MAERERQERHESETQGSHGARKTIMEAAMKKLLGGAVAGLSRQFAAKQ